MSREGGNYNILLQMGKLKLQKARLLNQGKKDGILEQGLKPGLSCSRNQSCNSVCALNFASIFCFCNQKTMKIYVDIRIMQ